MIVGSITCNGLQVGTIDVSVGYSEAMYSASNYTDMGSPVGQAGAGIPSHGRSDFGPHTTGHAGHGHHPNRLHPKAGMHHVVSHEDGHDGSGQHHGVTPHQMHKAAVEGATADPGKAKHMDMAEKVARDPGEAGHEQADAIKDPGKAKEMDVAEKTARDPGQAAVSGKDSGDLNKGAYEKMFAGTPLAGQSEKVAAEAKKNNIPPSLMAAIMAHETGRGTSHMLRSRNNPAGLMDPATGASTGKTFGSVEEGIEEAGRTIARNYNRGGRTIAGMARSYAPPGAANDPGGLNRGWPAGVSRYQRELQSTPGTEEPPSSGLQSAPIAPGAVLAPNANPPAAFIMHHTGGRGTPENVVADWRAHRPGIGTQYIMDREGNIHDIRKELGYPGTSHIISGYGPKGAGLTNRNVVGMEVIARDDKDVTQRQKESAQKFIRENYPSTPVFGHGEVNPGHREADEGMTIVNAIRRERVQQAQDAKDNPSGVGHN